MNAYKIKRRSHCDVCDRRLSSKDLFGDIRWQPSNVDDSGITCNPCYKTLKKQKARKELRA